MPTVSVTFSQHTMPKSQFSQNGDDYAHFSGNFSEKLGKVRQTYGHDATNLRFSELWAKTAKRIDF